MTSLTLNVLAVFFLLTQSAGLDAGSQLLHEVSEKYDSLTNYVSEGYQTVVLPNTDCHIEFPFEVARFTPSTSESALPPTIRFHGTKVLRQQCRDEIAKEHGGLTEPGLWADLATIDSGAVSVQDLDRQILHLAQHVDISCIVLEVQYDDFNQRVRNIVGPVRYWIEPTSRLIRRVEFNDVATQGPARPWNVTIEGIRIGGPPPAWYGLDRPSYAAPKIMGASAPDFKGQTADSRTIRLTDLRGKVVLLDFWATWCTACLEEMPVLEKLQSEEAISKIVVLGVSDEGGATVQNWLKRNGRSFRTLVDAKEIFAAFSIGPIPARVIVNEQGIVTRYFLGFDSEDRIRQALADALADRTKSPAVSP